ncbi:MAG: FAD-dependent oxidoreductase, partial [Pseudonocardia sp.]|nr:FAD-dependent oxidoreductase [Pseudonocardia sp.]
MIVGGGVMGCAAAWQAARRGLSVILLEQFQEGHTVGASHGATRNFNLGYEQDDYLGLGLEARGLWDELATEAGRPMLDLAGLISHGWVEPLRRVARSHERWGIDSAFLSPGEAGARWPGMRFRSDVLHVPAAGRVRAADALVAFREVATAAGADFRYSTPVREIAADGPAAVVVTDRDEVRSRRAIITAGAWSSSLLAPLLEPPKLVVTQEQPAHFAALDPTYEWPSFNHTPDPDEPDDAYWYSPTYGMLAPG